MGVHTRMSKSLVTKIVELDPTARNRRQVIFTYSGVHAIMFYRMSHLLWKYHARSLASLITQLSTALTNITIHPNAKLGRRTFILHGAPVVIEQNVMIGDDCTLYPGTLIKGNQRLTNIEDGVIIEEGAVIGQGVTIGHHSVIKDNAQVYRSVPSRCKVMGIVDEGN